MNVRLLCSSAASLLLLVACGGGATPRPDGGVAVCNPNDERFLVVRVQDAVGQPVPEAVVTARNEGNGNVVTATTNNEGVTTAFGTSMGSGSITVQAQAGQKVTNVGQAEFSCGECGCNIDPDNLTLTLNP